MDIKSIEDMCKKEFIAKYGSRPIGSHFIKYSEYWDYQYKLFKEGFLVGVKYEISCL